MGLTPETAFGCAMEFLFPPKPEIYRRAACPGPSSAVTVLHAVSMRTCTTEILLPWCSHVAAEEAALRGNRSTLRIGLQVQLLLVAHGDTSQIWL